MALSRRRVSGEYLVYRRPHVSMLPPISAETVATLKQYEHLITAPSPAESLPSIPTLPPTADTTADHPSLPPAAPNVPACEPAAAPSLPATDVTELPALWEAAVQDDTLPPYDAVQSFALRLSALLTSAASSASASASLSSPTDADSTACTSVTASSLVSYLHEHVLLGRRQLKRLFPLPPTAQRERVIHMQLIVRLYLQSLCAAAFDDLSELLQLLSAHGHRSGYELMHQVLTPHFGLQQRETLRLLCKEMDWAVPLELARAGSGAGEKEEKIAEETEDGQQHDDEDDLFPLKSAASTGAGALPVKTASASSSSSSSSTASRSLSRGSSLSLSSASSAATAPASLSRPKPPAEMVRPALSNERFPSAALSAQLHALHQQRAKVEQQRREELQQRMSSKRRRQEEAQEEQRRRRQSLLQSVQVRRFGTAPRASTRISLTAPLPQPAVQQLFSPSSLHGARDASAASLRVPETPSLPMTSATTRRPLSSSSHLQRSVVVVAETPQPAATGRRRRRGHEAGRALSTSKRSLSAVLQSLTPPA